MPEIITRAEAREQGLTRYFTGPCSHGHFSVRRVDNKTCVECLYESGERSRAAKRLTAHQSKLCQHCGGPFGHSRHSRKFCSEECRQACPTNRDKANVRAKAYYVDNREDRLAYSTTYREAHSEELNAYSGRKRVLDMARNPHRFRKAYDPNCRPFPARYDPVVGEWVRCKQTILRAPDTSPEAHLAAALIVIDERLAHPND